MKIIPEKKKKEIFKKALVCVCARLVILINIKLILILIFARAFLISDSDKMPALFRQNARLCS